MRKISLISHNSKLAPPDWQEELFPLCCHVQSSILGDHWQQEEGKTQTGNKSWNKQEKVKKQQKQINRWKSCACETCHTGFLALVFSFGKVLIFGIRLTYLKPNAKREILHKDHILLLPNVNSVTQKKRTWSNVLKIYFTKECALAVLCFVHHIFHYISRSFWNSFRCNFA